MMKVPSAQFDGLASTTSDELTLPMRSRLLQAVSACFGAMIGMFSVLLSARRERNVDPESVPETRDVVETLRVKNVATAAARKIQRMFRKQRSARYYTAMVKAALRCSSSSISRSSSPALLRETLSASSIVDTLDLCVDWPSPWLDDASGPLAPDQDDGAEDQLFGGEHDALSNDDVATEPDASADGCIVDVDGVQNPDSQAKHVRRRAVSNARRSWLLLSDSVFEKRQPPIAPRSTTRSLGCPVMRVDSPIPSLSSASTRSSSFSSSSRSAASFATGKTSSPVLTSAGRVRANSSPTPWTEGLPPVAWASMPAVRHDTRCSLTHSCVPFDDEMELSPTAL